MLRSSDSGRSVDEPNFDKLWFDAGHVFTPGSPVNERDLFAGRSEQISSLMEVISQRGFHGVIYGDRGVGKTSITNVLPQLLQDAGVSPVFPRTNCDATDTYSSLWAKILRDITIAEERPGLGFGAISTQDHKSLIDSVPFEMRPDDVRRVLTQVGQSTFLVVGIDEFDRLTDRTVPALMADTIKALSDSAAPVTLLLVGVAESVDQLIEGHRSVERSLVQIPMPRMTKTELELIVLNGLKRLGMTIQQDSVAEVVSLSQGLPYITHMISLHASRAALHARRLNIGYADIAAGIKKSLEQWQQSIVSAYYDAVRSPQPEHIYRQVLLACALAECDEKGFFSAAAVRQPLQVVSERPSIDIPNFSRHLKEFCEARRANILMRAGETRRFRYRFLSPMMRPYVLMRGVADGMLTPEKLETLQLT